MDWKRVRFARIKNYIHYSNSIIIEGKFLKKFQNKYVGRTFNKVNSKKLIKWTLFCHIMSIYEGSRYFEERFFKTPNKDIWVTDTFAARKNLSQTVFIRCEYFLQLELSSRNIFLVYRIEKTTDRSMNKGFTPILENKERHTKKKEEVNKQSTFGERRSNKIIDYEQFKMNKPR